MTRADNMEPKKRLSRRAIIIASSTALVLICGGATAFGVNHYNAETVRLCDTALTDAASAHDAAESSLSNAAGELEAVSSTVLPDGQISTAYADRAATHAMPAVPASEGLQVIAAVEAKPAGAAFITDVTSARSEVPADFVPTTCSSRDEAATITATTEDLIAKTAALDTAVSALSVDFTAFQSTEMDRIASDAANTAMSGAAQSLSEAQTAAQTVLDAASSDADGYAATETGVALLADLQAKLDASKGLDTSAASTTVEEALLVTGGAQTATDTTAVLVAATTALADSLSTHQGAKETERANAAAAENNAGSSRDNGSGSKNGTGTTTKPPSTKPPVDSGGTSTNPPADPPPSGALTPPGGLPPDKGKGGEICYNGQGGTVPCP